MAVPGKDIVPRIGEVAAIPPNAKMDSEVTLTLWEAEKSTHKPKWLRYYKKSSQQTLVPIPDILLYDFSLTNKAMLRKTTREYLMNINQ